MITKTTILAVAAALATAAATAGNGEQGTSPGMAPFRDMHESPNVTTSRDEYGIWLNWEADAFEIRYPDQDRAFDRETLEPGELGPRLLLTCRADGRGANGRGPQRLRIEAYLRMHPDAADVPGPFSIRYYLRLLYGEWDDWPGRVQLGELKERDGRIRRQRAHYSFARPELHIVGVGGYAQQALAQIEARRAWRLQVEGEGLRVDANFPRQPTETGAAASQMRLHCPQERNAAAQ